MNPRCYYCNGQIPNMPWHYRDPYLCKVAKICDRCYNERGESRDRSTEDGQDGRGLD